MLFNSIEFCLFFVVVNMLYFSLKHEFRWLLLLVSSCFFYMFYIPYYILILGFTIVIDYFIGIYLEELKLNNRNPKPFLIFSIIINISILFFFKYYNFFLYGIQSVALNFQIHIPVAPLSFLLPIGLSFHTFQAMSYTIEVYRGNQKAERHFGIYALYVMFFPQLVAGPIERPQNLLHQFHEKHYFDYDRIKSGLILMLWGLFKKVVIADRLALYSDVVFQNPQQYHGIALIIATFFFTFQIYCDFSGYSDIAIGAARVMGFTLMRNFNFPYFAYSISDFWKRWHISLSTWFKDYLYIPLGGNRVDSLRFYFNILVVFAISGLWHGANWTFLCWGILQGIFLIFETIVPLYFLPKSIRFIITFLLISVSWIIFRSNSISDSVYVLTHLFYKLDEQLSSIFIKGVVNIGVQTSRNSLLLSFFLISIIIAIEFLDKKYSISILLSKMSSFLRWCIYYAIILAILFLGVYENKQFIYFQF
jgi:alginate O-acetyltransferase complex protein AlgI